MDKVLVISGEDGNTFAIPLSQICYVRKGPIYVGPAGDSTQHKPGLTIYITTPVMSSICILNKEEVNRLWEFFLARQMVYM